VDFVVTRFLLVTLKILIYNLLLIYYNLLGIGGRKPNTYQHQYNFSYLYPHFITG